MRYTSTCAAIDTSMLLSKECMGVTWIACSSNGKGVCPPPFTCDRRLFLLVIIRHIRFAYCVPPFHDKFIGFVIVIKHYDT